MRGEKFVVSAISTAIVAVLVSSALAQQPSPAGGNWPEFNGRDSLLILESGKLVNTNFEHITVEAWVYLRSLPETEHEAWVIAAKPGTFELLIVGAIPGKPHFGPFGVAFLSNTADDEHRTWTGGLTTRIPKGQLNKWYHVSGSHDSRSHLTRLAFDGEYLCDAEVLGKLENPGSPLYIGGMIDEVMIFQQSAPDRKVEDSFFDGFIDEVRISSIVRYRGDFKPPNGHFEADPRTLALWHFDQATGFFTDLSGNGNTLIGMGVGLPVEPAGRLTTTWAGMKSGLRLQ